MTQWTSPHINKMNGYTPGLQIRGDHSVIKLNTNESPYDPPSHLSKVLQNISLDDLRRYPDPLATSLRRKIAKQYGLDEHWILLGNGSDEILTMLMRSCVQPPKEEILFPRLTYSLYRVLGDIQNIKNTTLPVLDDGSFCLKTISESDAKILFLANPNPPSGAFLSLESVKEIHSCFSGLLVIDEAYVDFAEKNCLVFAKEHRDVVVVRTFSKSYSLAGIRLGWAIAHPSLINEFFKVRDSYNVNVITQKIGEAVLDCQSEIDHSIQKIKETRDIFTEYLLSQKWQVSSSQANFVWAKPPCDAGNLYHYLLDNKILVRYFQDFQDHLRMTIGTPEQMRCLQETLNQYAQ